MSCRSPGSVLDSTAFGVTTLGRMLMDPHHAVTARLIEEGYCIVGDEAYAASEVMAVPWPGGGRGDRWKDSFNFYQSSCRIHIEQAFGMLVWRWGVFWRPLRVPSFKAAESGSCVLQAPQPLPPRGKCVDCLAGSVWGRSCGWLGMCV